MPEKNELPPLTEQRLMRAARARRSSRLTLTAIMLVSLLFALLCALALVAEPPGRGPRSEPAKLELE